MPSCLSGLVRVGGYNTDRVLRAVLSVGVTTQTACYVPSCLSGLVRVGGGLQHRPSVTCRPVCRGWLGWGVTTQTACYVPSCLSGLQHRPRVTCRPVCRGWLGWGGGYNTDRVLRAVLSVGVG